MYSVSPLGDGGSYTLGRMGTAKNFVLSARIRGGNGKEVGIGLQYRGANEKGEEVEKNLMLIKAGSGTLVVFYSWQGECSAARSPISWDNGNANDFKYTVVRKDYYTREMMNEGDNPPIGIVLCADKSDAVVKYTLPEDNNQIFASKYKLYMPTEEEFKKELKLDDYKRLDRE